MTVDFLEYGETYPDLNSEHMISLVARKTLRLVNEPAQRNFELVELRQLRNEADTIADVIVVDCLNDQVPTRNTVGIKNRERLALVFEVDELRMPSVRTLRKDFPVTLHQNQVDSGAPTSLCLYFEPWTAVQRTWTPQKHLFRVLWWLAETSKGTLHRADQPVEQLYFDSPIKLVIPPDFDDLCQKENLILTMTAVEPIRDDSDQTVLIGEFVPKSEAYKNNGPRHVPIVVIFPPVVHGAVERFPNTLGELDDQLSARGISIFETICQEVRRLTPCEGIVRDTKGCSLLILKLSVKRTEYGPIEKVEYRAFWLRHDFSVLGEALGVLAKHAGKYFAVGIIGGVANDHYSGSWRQIPVIPVEVKRQVTQEFARKASGVDEETSNFNGILAGAGALGGALADLWSREAWGKWTIVDHDYVEPHNVIRHVAKNFQVGTNKADATKCLLEANFFQGVSHVEAIKGSIVDLDNSRIQESVASADILIDATTTLYVPRELSQNPINPRAVSVFLTPSGFGSVLLMEDAERHVRLESLETQYYRAIINNEWGSTHLGGHLGQLWVGAGCRDVSAVISFEMILLHAATLARRVRTSLCQQTPSIYVWEANPSTGSISAYTPPVFQTITTQSNSWRVLWDEEVRDNLVSYRAQCLPNETGGVILGYIDQKLRTIFVVDVLSSPPDSDVSPSGFTRGVSGLQAELDKIAMRTANIVGYIGDWHSHPPQCSARPSLLDNQLIQTLAETLAQDGQPALMMIVGADGISLTVREV